jgi:hypothetical protein
MPSNPIQSGRYVAQGSGTCNSGMHALNTPAALQGVITLHETFLLSLGHVRRELRDVRLV